MAHIRRNGQPCQGRYFLDPSSMQHRCSACKEVMQPQQNAPKKKPIEASSESVDAALRRRLHPDEVEKVNPYKEGIIADMGTVDDLMRKAVPVQAASPFPVPGLRTSEGGIIPPVPITDELVPPEMQQAKAAELTEAVRLQGIRSDVLAKAAVALQNPQEPGAATAVAEPPKAADAPPPPMPNPNSPLLDAIRSAADEGHRIKEEQKGGGRRR